MSLQIGPGFWEPLLAKILGKTDQGSLSQKKARKKLAKKASKLLGLDPGNEEIAKAADFFLIQARASGKLQPRSTSDYLRQPGSQPQKPRDLPQGIPSKPVPSGATECPPVPNRGGATGTPNALPAEQPRQKKRKHAQTEPARHSSREDGQQEAGAQEPASTKKKKKEKQQRDAGASTDQLVLVTPQTSRGNVPGEHRTQQGSVDPGAAAASLQEASTKKKKKRKIKGASRQEPLPAPLQRTAAPAAAKHAAKKRKKGRESTAEQAAQEQDAQAAAAAAPGSVKELAAAAGRKPLAKHGSKEAAAAAVHTAKPAKKKKKALAAAAAAEMQAAPTEGAEAAGAASVKAAKKKGGRSAKQSEVATAEAEQGPSAKAKTAAASVSVHDTRTWREDYKRTDVKHGNFSQQERETIRQAVKEYAELHGKSQTDLEWLFSTSRHSAEHHKTSKGAWKEIAAALPHRKAKAVWSCGTRMLHVGNFKGKWSAEEEQQLKELHAAKGDRWKEIGDLLGRMPESVRDKCRSMKLGDAKVLGAWTPQEEGKLVNLVNAILAERPAERPVDGRIVLDDLPWDIISSQHGTRDQTQCRLKWYQSLSPSMVDRGDWGAGDDRRLLKSLFRAGAAYEWEVDWGALVPGRAAAVTRRRWRLMLKCVPDAAEKGFDESVDFLVDAYTPDLKKKAQAADA